MTSTATRYVDYVCSWGPLILGHAHPASSRRSPRRRRAARASARRRPARSSSPRRSPPHPVGRDVAHDLVGDRGDDERAPPRPRGHRPRADPQVRRRLPRPRRRAARRGRLGPGHAGHPGQPGRAGGRGGRDRDRALERPRGALREPSSDDVRRASSPSPIPANMGLVPPDDGFLRAPARGSPTRTARCSSSTRSSPASGSRRGGAQELYGVVPDLTILGKIIGGGLPAAAYGGRRELMERIAPAGDVYQAGTLSGNPLAVAAGLATLRAARRVRLRSGSAQTTEALADGMRDGGRQAGVPVQVRSRPGLMTVFFSERARHRLRRRRRVRHRGLRRLVPRAAGARRLPAAVAVRGLVPVAGARRRRHRRARSRRRRAAFGAIGG